MAGSGGSSGVAGAGGTAPGGAGAGGLAGAAGSGGIAAGGGSAGRAGSGGTAGTGGRGGAAGAPSGDCQPQPTLDLVCAMISTEPHYFFCQGPARPQGTCTEESEGAFCCR
jgi:hypothetical protein